MNQRIAKVATKAIAAEISALITFMGFSPTYRPMAARTGTTAAKTAHTGQTGIQAAQTTADGGGDERLTQTDVDAEQSRLRHAQQSGHTAGNGQLTEVLVFGLDGNAEGCGTCAMLEGRLPGPMTVS